MVFGDISDGIADIAAGVGKTVGIDYGSNTSFQVSSIQVQYELAKQGYRYYQYVTGDLDLNIPDIIDRGDDGSATYSWKGIQTSYGIGQSVAIAYGEHDLGGQVISSSVDLLTAAQSELQSDVERLNTLLALCEGPIDSIGNVQKAVNGATFISPNKPFPENIRVNGIAQQGGVEMSTRLGALYQTPIPGFEASRTTVTVGGELEQRNQQVIATVPFPDATMMRVRITFPSGLRRQANGQQFGERVDFRISWRQRRGATQGPWSAPIVFDVEPGFARNNEFSVWATFRVNPWTGPTFDGYDIRVQRLTDIGEQRQQNNEFIADFAVWEEFEAVVEQRFAHPRTALFAVRLPANDILRGGQPQYQIPGRWRKVKVYDAAVDLEPSADRFWQLPASGPYASIWNHPPGRNPAWIAADLIEAEFGLGRHGLEIDWPAFRDWADFCDQDAPEGGPLCACDLVVDRATNEWDVLLRIFRAGRAVPLLDGLKIKPVYEYRDAHGRGANSVPAKQRVAIASDDNVAGFSMSYVSTFRRPNLYAAQFLNADLSYEIDTAIVEDQGPDAQAFGLVRQVPTRKVQTEFFGVTRRRQVERELKLRAELNRLSTKRCSFTAAPDLMHVEIGDVIGVAHDVTRPTENGGPTVARLLPTGGSGFAIDKPLTIATANSTAIQGIKADGTPGTWVISSAGTFAPGDELSTSGTMPAFDLPDGSVVVIGDWDGDAAGNGTAAGLEDFVVTRTTLNPDGTKSIQARLWAPSAFDVDAESVPESTITEQQLVELGVPEASDAISPTVDQPEASGITLQPSASGRGHELAWQMPATHRGKVAKVYVDDSFGNPQLVGESSNGRLEIEGLEPSRATGFRVVVEDRDGTFATVGNTTPVSVQPSEFRFGSMHPISGLAAQALNDGRVVVTWQPTPGDDVQFVEVRIGESWEAGRLIGRTADQRIEITDLVPTVPVTILARPRYLGGLFGPVAVVGIEARIPDGQQVVAAS